MPKFTETVLLASELLEEDGSRLGRLEVEIRFEALLENIFRLGWWQSETAYLTDETGRLLLRTGAAPPERRRLGEADDPLENRLLEKMARQSSGTVLGPGHPPQQVAGFCRTETAGWFLVLIAPGKSDCLRIEHSFETNLKGIREPVRLAVVSGCPEADGGN